MTHTRSAARRPFFVSRPVTRVLAALYALAWGAAPVVDAQFGHGTPSVAAVVVDGADAAPGSGGSPTCAVCDLLHASGGEVLGARAPRAPLGVRPAHAPHEAVVPARLAYAAAQSRAPPIS